VTTTDSGLGTIKDGGVDAGDDNIGSDGGSPDDDRPVFSVNDVTVNEGAGTLTFTITKSGITELPASVDYAIGDSSTNQGTDYTGTYSGTLNFAANETTQSVTLNITNDNLYEISETLGITSETAAAWARFSTTARAAAARTTMRL